MKKARPAKHLLGEPSSGPYVVVQQTTFSSVQLRDPATPFDGSLVRLAFAELAQRIHRTGTEIMGAEALIDGPWMHDYLESYSETIAGGTAEIQRNIIAERILGLPREPRP